MSKDKDLRYIRTDKIRPHETALRGVNQESEEFLGLVESIKSVGVLQTIQVREIKDENGEIVYGLVDGLQRTTAALAAGLETIPAHIVEANDVEVLERQIISNVQRIDTKPIEYSKQLTRLLLMTPTMSMADLATKVGKSYTWLTDRLSLTRLTPDIQKLVNDDTIKLANAYTLAKLPADEQAAYVDRAITIPAPQFMGMVKTRAKELRDAKAQGRKAAGPSEFVATPFLQKIGTIRDEIDKATIGRVLINDNGITDPVEAFQLALRWVLHLDPASIKIAKAKDDERKRKLDEAKTQRALERKEAKEKEAAETAAELVEV